MSAASPPVTVRRGQPDDLQAIVALAGSALGWSDGGPHVELFRWKHLDNPFGASPAWVAECAGELVGFRTFLRWRWVGPGGTRYAAVRAVDTATHPEHQGKGIFTLLTRHALVDLAQDGVDFVFNTPNDQSRPGYLRMGWRELGRVPVVVRPAGPGALRRMAKSRQPADKWSLATAAGVPALDFFTDDEATARLLATTPVSRRLVTDRSPAFLRWRYRLGPLHYRCFPLGDRVEDGAIVFRVRQRGIGREVTVGDVVAPARPGRALGGALAAVLRATEADYALAGRPSLPRSVALPMPRQGPTLTWRDVRPVPPMALSDFALTLGDIELF